MTVNVKIVMMEHLWCDFFCCFCFNTKWGGRGGNETERMNMSKITQIKRIGEKFLFNCLFYVSCL